MNQNVVQNIIIQDGVKEGCAVFVDPLGLYYGTNATGRSLYGLVDYRNGRVFEREEHVSVVVLGKADVIVDGAVKAGESLGLDAGKGIVSKSGAKVPGFLLKVMEGNDSGGHIKILLSQFDV